MSERELGRELERMKEFHGDNSLRLFVMGGWTTSIIEIDISMSQWACVCRAISQQKPMRRVRQSSGIVERKHRNNATPQKKEHLHSRVHLMVRQVRYGEMACLSKTIKQFQRIRLDDSERESATH